MNKFKWFLTLMVVFAMIGCQNITDDGSGAGGGSSDTPPSSPTVTISPNTASLAKSSQQAFTARVTGLDNPTQSVLWSMSGSTNPGTTFKNGLLTISATETTKSITITAKSVADMNLVGRAVITVTNETATVESVTVTPTTASVAKGYKQDFTVVVTGEHKPIKTVTWSMSGANHAGTKLENGKLTVSTSETAMSITVTATSTFNNTKTGSATITVREPTAEEAFLFNVAGKAKGKILIGKMGTHDIEFSTDGKTCTMTMFGGASKVSSTFDSVKSVGKAYYKSNVVTESGEVTDEETYTGITVSEEGIGHYYMPGMGEASVAKENVFDGTKTAYPFDLMGGTPTEDQVIRP